MRRKNEIQDYNDTNRRQTLHGHDRNDGTTRLYNTSYFKLKLLPYVFPSLIIIGLIRYGLLLQQLHDHVPVSSDSTPTIGTTSTFTNNSNIKNNTETTTTTTSSSTKTTKTITNPPQQQQQKVQLKTVQQNAPPFHFAGCLMIKDDNILLPEWLAYHYTVLPLRRLILAIDYGDRISPNTIIDAYHNYTDLKVTTWHLLEPIDILVGKRKGSENKTNKPAADIYSSDPDSPFQRKQNYIVRQLVFYRKCMTILKFEGWTWTVLIDSDEYVVPNSYHDDETNQMCEDLNSNSSSSPEKMEECTNQWKKDMKNGKLERSTIQPIIPPIINTTTTNTTTKNNNTTESLSLSSSITTIAHYIGGNNTVGDDNTITSTRATTNTTNYSTGIINTTIFNVYPCITIPRVLFGPQKSSIKEINKYVPNKFNSINFRTLRDRYHQPWQTYVPGKSLVDVSRYDLTEIRSPHKILKEKCNIKKSFIPRFYKSLFRIHHYTGTLDEFLFRSGDSHRRGINQFQKRLKWSTRKRKVIKTLNETNNNNNKRQKIIKEYYNGTDDDIRGWLYGFIQSVGSSDLAYNLTEGLKSWAIQQYTINTNNTNTTTTTNTTRTLSVPTKPQLQPPTNTTRKRRSRKRQRKKAKEEELEEEVEEEINEV